MLLDAYGKEIKTSKPETGQQIRILPSDREVTDISRGLTPLDVDRIMMLANDGDVSEQCRLSMELEEKNWDIAQALQTRVNAVLGVNYEILPGGDAEEDVKVTEALSDVIADTGQGDEDSFDEMLSDMLTAILPGFAISEIVWSDTGFSGFSFIDQKFFTFRNSYQPKLITENNYEGELLPYAKIITHKYRRHGNDPARGGLIRPLAWLHCFSNISFKDLLRFIERYGMPFAVAKVDQSSWENEREVIKDLIRSFGPDGGGVFTQSTELDLLQASNNTGDVYFELMKYVGDAIVKVILGQTASSGDGGGWSKDGAQNAVRQDILESDCKKLENTMNTQLFRWFRDFYFPNAKIPVLSFKCEVPEDQEKVYSALEKKFTAMDTAIKAGLLTPTQNDESAIRKMLGLEELSTEAITEWQRGKGVKLPSTLNYSDIPGREPSVQALSDDAGKVAKIKSEDKNMLSDEELLNWGDKFAKEAWSLSEDATGKDLESVSKNPEKYLNLLKRKVTSTANEEEMFGGYAEGMQKKSEDLKGK